MTQLEFFNLLDNSESGREYLRLINLASSRDKVEGRVEKHHIHPKGLGGCVASPSNLVYLTIYEHCLAHVLLARAIPCSATFKPIVRMKRQYDSLVQPEQCTLEEIYQWSIWREKAIHGSHSPEHSAAISRARKGQVCNNKGTVWMNKNGVNSRVKCGLVEQQKKDGWKEGRTEQTRINICKAREGQPGTRLGTHNSEATRKKLSQKLSGRIWITNGYVSKAVLKGPDQEQIYQKYLKEGWVHGRKPYLKS